MKINSSKKQNHWYLIHTWSDRAFKGTVVNRTLPSLHGGLLNITLLVLLLFSRSKEQRYTRLADWEYIKECRETVNIPVFGNGDILNYEVWFFFFWGGGARASIRVILAQIWNFSLLESCGSRTSLKVWFDLIFFFLYGLAILLMFPHFLAIFDQLVSFVITL